MEKELQFLSTSQIDEFNRNGILRLRGAVPRRDAERMCDSVREVLAERQRNSPSTENVMGRVIGTHWLPKRLKFEQVGSESVRAATDDLLGIGGWQEPERWTPLLVTFPSANEVWDVPRQWHFDYPSIRATQGLFGLRVFTCLADLAPHGGGTLVVTGSHRLAQRVFERERRQKLRGRQVRMALARDLAWFSALCAREPTPDRSERFMNTTTRVDDVELRVEEMSGETGDVILMHPLCLHASSSNCRSTPRIVVAATIVRKHWKFIAPDD
ncbi:MAG TPA: phytanoyl-CoA dioxygenase family protein [Candidatus Binataceae bacterium]|nr:phytanoyl-CoA dioxygenase family protein [Candidatus Binataceae bacterium]